MYEPMVPGNLPLQDVMPSEGPVLIGESPGFRFIVDRLPSIARAQRTTLIAGPTGSGKDMIARALHEHSPRRQLPYVTVHCAALPESLVEAEMFGHSRGAFTGATQSRPGLVRSASAGTLFLDEIDSLPASAQAKLLRFLETGEYRAVGSDRVEHSTAWVIAATNQDLNERVRHGSFRADLMYRLAVVKVNVPPLNQRRTDILGLADYFLQQLAQGRKRFSEEARQALLDYAWPGNVRELKHRVESAALFSDSPILDVATLSLDDDPGARVAPPTAALPLAASPSPSLPTGKSASELPQENAALEGQLWRMVKDEGLSLSQAITRCEHLLVQAALRAEGNNRTRAAHRLGIHVRTIFKKLT